MLRNDSESQSATRSEAPFDPHVPGVTSANEIVEDPIDDRFVERMDVTIRGQIQLERLGFEAPCVGNIFDKNLGEIRLAGHGAKRREIRAINPNQKIAVDVRIGKRLQRGLLRRFGGRGLRVAQER